MKGQFCDKKPELFCQEDSCDNCTVKPPPVFRAKVEAHNLNKIETEPYFIRFLTDAYLPNLILNANNLVRDNSYYLHGGFSITVTYTKGE
jgi:hypothetical protein